MRALLFLAPTLHPNMGLLSSKPQPLDPEQVISKRLESSMAEAKAADRERVKVLLLGASDSGKSTLFKQMQILYGDRMSARERTDATPVVRRTTLGSMKGLVEQSEANGNAHYVQCKAEFALVKDSAVDAKLDMVLGGAIKALWADAAIRRTWDDRATFDQVGVADSAALFFDKMDSIMAPDYAADEEDILHCRVRTSNLHEATYTIAGTTCVFYDAGGLRHLDRSRWLHYFTGVDTVIYVASLSEYDEMLLEDNLQPRHIEALECFREINQNSLFAKPRVVLCLNKSDLLKEKITRVPIRGARGGFLDFPIAGRAGDTVVKRGRYYTAAVKYFQTRFEACAGESGLPITHITCAVDGDSVRSLIDLLELSKVSKVVEKEEKEGGGKAKKAEKKERRRKGSARSMSVDSA